MLKQKVCLTVGFFFSWDMDKIEHTKEGLIIKRVFEDIGDSDLLPVRIKMTKLK